MKKILDQSQNAASQRSLQKLQLFLMFEGMNDLIMAGVNIKSS
jgi:predicted lysophospholipase L1 biosynthesis ABC-type transport system permease subunit